MEYRTLGRTGLRVAVMSLGTGGPSRLGQGSGVDEAEAQQVVRRALELGINFIDTAAGYGDSEAILGEALQDGYRGRCFLATKVSGDFSPEATIRAMENSLRAMRVEYVDLYQVHWWDSRYPIEATMETLAKLQGQGKTRYIAVSNFDTPQMQKAAKTAPFQVNQVVYNMLERGIERIAERSLRGRPIVCAIAAGSTRRMLLAQPESQHHFAAGRHVQCEMRGRLRPHARRVDRLRIATNDIRVERILDVATAVRRTEQPLGVRSRARGCGTWNLLRRSAPRRDVVRR